MTISILLQLTLVSPKLLVLCIIAYARFFARGVFQSNLFSTLADLHSASDNQRKRTCGLSKSTAMIFAS
jgi:hypothetical protein